MLIVRRHLVDRIEAAKSKEDLYPVFQGAVSLELSTIPVYLTGVATLKKAGTGEVNEGVAQLVEGIAFQEMVHTTLVANMLIALGGRPILNTSEVVPTYPGPLPCGADAGLVVHMRPISLAVVQDTYMSIEEPDTIVQPTGTPIPLLPPRLPDPRLYASIGDFYRALIAKIQDLPAGSFDPSTASCQVPRVLGVKTTITDLTTATAALDLIISQGEGTSKSPIQDDGKEPAHFYDFAQIVMGRRIEVTGATYDFSGAPVPFDPCEVHAMIPDPTLELMERILKPADFATCEAFSKTYTRVLDLLNDTFGGNPGRLRDAIRAMGDLASQADDVLAIPVGGAGLTAGLCFELRR